MTSLIRHTLTECTDRYGALLKFVAVVLAGCNSFWRVGIEVCRAEVAILLDVSIEMRGTELNKIKREIKKC